MFGETEDQDLFEQAAARFLEAHYPVARVRALAADATYLLVTAAEPAGRTQYLVPFAAPGVELVPLRSIDLTRRFHDVTLRDVELPVDARVGRAGGADDQDAHLLDVAAVMALG